jgi:hypothetical protein
MGHMRQRFPILYTGINAKLFPLLALPRSSAYVELDDDSLRVQLGWGFTARIPRRSISAAERGKDVAGITAGAHGWRGRWLVNGSRRGIVRLDIDPPVRAWTLAIPVRLRQLLVSLEDPEGFLTALAAPADT